MMIICFSLIALGLICQLYLHKKMGKEDERTKYLTREMQRVAALTTLFYIVVVNMFFNIDKILGINNILLTVTIFVVSATLYGFKIIK
ncbi:MULTISPECIES: hypothetical protein [Virgibacillus]|uniref:DUF2178 domain-containing protein n=2 Tax=Virgibacillus pantothenticus TaxID=1473 RepID=A0A0L0QR46_VIRPA|nr:MULTISPECIES: hypothetical protein [Virgibacillus]API90740.1 hypothetical protein BKP57_02005 [Virgibacillus sp. 6R]KNE20688.1 hypothetical protein AFK71_20330 [Virgibacillus pantothenticus]MED3739366.1 hypothetical protein [Virgibacillus pantothenticus]QTY17549.1 hypothetical protein KBP50_06785 [Virgibacillus pantothenticus]SIT17737.1 hypothetical protein SAMN05421787_1344 [Virgibacillus pantothenticus]